MTYVPVCDFDGHFWPKRKHLFYIGIGSGADFVRYRLRFCGHHVETVQEDLAENEVLPIQTTARSVDGRMANCFSCGEPIQQGGVSWFITCYPTQDERKDYWGRLHQGHTLPGYLQERVAP